MEYDIFLSHNRENKIKTAFPLYQTLETLGFNIWFDRKEILPGNIIYEPINDGISCSSIIIALITNTYLHRTWTQHELNLAIKIESECQNGISKRLFPIYQQINAENVVKVFPQLHNRAYEIITQDYFDISLQECRNILDRIVMWYFLNSIPFPCLNDWDWLKKYKKEKYIGQLLILLHALKYIDLDLRTLLINYTNTIRYLIAILYEKKQTNSVTSHLIIAERYCADISSKCFLFHHDVSYEMMLCCKAILSTLNSNLKAVLDSV